MIQTAAIPKGQGPDRYHHVVDEENSMRAACGIKLDSRFQYEFLEPADLNRGWPPVCGQCKNALKSTPPKSTPR